MICTMAYAKLLRGTGGEHLPAAKANTEDMVLTSEGGYKIQYFRMRGWAAQNRDQCSWRGLRLGSWDSRGRQGGASRDTFDAEHRHEAAGFRGWFWFCH